MNLGFATLGIGWTIALAAFGILLGALLLRSACDLCTVEPAPSYWRCLALTIALGLIGVPMAYGVWWAGTRITGQLGVAPDNGPFLAAILALPLLAIVCILLYIAALRVRPGKAATIWLVKTLITSVVGAVLAMLVVGGWTIVDGVRRLF